jgi:hypothetical protein
MNEVWQQIEQVLGAAYERQAASYAEALHRAEALLAAWQRGDEAKDALPQIHALVEQIAQSSAAIAAPRQQWLQSGQQPGTALRTALETVTAQIECLRQRIRELELWASAQKNRLAPELDLLVRGRQMRQAYGAARR